MILLDTHIFIWWVMDNKKLEKATFSLIQKNENKGIGVSIISLQEIAKLFEYKRLKLPIDISEWLDLALNYQGIEIINLDKNIIIQSTSLKGTFHKDPADQIITATSIIK